MAHPDFQFHNILFDDNWTVVGVIDWTYTHTVPVETFCTVPGGHFLFHESHFNRRIGPYADMDREFTNSKLIARRTFLRALHEIEKQSKIEPLSAIYESPQARMALVFHEDYMPTIAEMHELAFGSADPGEIQAFCASALEASAKGQREMAGRKPV